MKNRRLAAFTLMEITIAMLISALVIGMTYAIYAIVTRSFTTFTQKNNTMAIITRLDELLRKDFDRAEQIEKTENGISLNGNGLIVTYALLPDAIVRHAGTIDTFKVSLLTSAATFENQPVGSTLSSAESGRIDDVHILFTIAGDTIPGHYHKMYSSVNLINRNAHALN